MFLCQPQAGSHQINLLFGCRDSALGLLLEGVQNVDRMLESHGINGAVRIAAIVFHHFEDSGPTEASERPGMRVPVTRLCKVEGVPCRILYVLRQSPQIFARRAHEE